MLACVAQNQAAVIAALVSIGAAVQIELAELRQPDSGTFRAQQAKLANSLTAYSGAAARVTDGRGVELVREYLIQ